MTGDSPKAKRLQEFRKRSGSVDAIDPLASFLYILMRDHLPPGTVENIMEEHIESCEHGTAKFTNGWLANHAKDIAMRLPSIAAEDTDSRWLLGEALKALIWQGGTIHQVLEAIKNHAEYYYKHHSHDALHESISSISDGGAVPPDTRFGGGGVDLTDEGVFENAREAIVQALEDPRSGRAREAGRWVGALYWRLRALREAKQPGSESERVLPTWVSTALLKALGWESGTLNQVLEAVKSHAAACVCQRSEDGMESEAAAKMEMLLQCVKRWAGNLAVIDNSMARVQNEVRDEMEGKSYHGISPATDWKIIRDQLHHRHKTPGAT